MTKPHSIWTHNCCKCNQPLMFTNDQFTGFAYHPSCAPSVDQEVNELGLIALFQGRSAADRVRDLLQELAAARLAGKVDGLEEAANWCGRQASALFKLSRENEKRLAFVEAHNAIRVKITELKATTTQETK
jgi:hypothetical protein